MQGPKNLLSALKDGAQAEGVLKPRSVTVNLGLVYAWTACVRGREGRGVPGVNSVKKAWFLAPPENPAQPIKSFCTAV